MTVRSKVFSCSYIGDKLSGWPYAAQSKAVATPIVVLGVDAAGRRTQVAPVGSGSSRSRPPVAIHRTPGEVAVGTVVVASTQELERPFINTIVVGGAGRIQHPVHGTKNDLPYVAIHAL